jgi:isoleucyl-tRNA synthetase
MDPKRLKETLNLPDKDFTIPMRADLAKREPGMQEKWDSIGIYERIQEHRKDADTFVLHDGPPYTNGPIHIGTALNKILKDFVTKSQTVMGKRAPYVPGYDNHGLPIELAVAKKFEEKGERPDIITFRRACRAHAEHFIDIQTEQFKRLGVFGMWDRPYVSMNYAHEAEIIRIFKRLVEAGLAYRGLRPVLWSPTSETALADTEIVYKDTVSPSIYVRFPLREDKNGVLKDVSNVYAIIWTTTPWTIPANLAVAFHPTLQYDLVKHGENHYLIEEHLTPTVAERCGLEGYELVRKIEGSEFEYTVFKHPIFDRDSLAVLADYVTTEDGTGIVHTAPGHGREDFMTGKKYNLDVLCPVDSKGHMTSEAGEFEGLFYKKANKVILQRLEEEGALLKSSDYHHTYPHAERDEKPVLFRATEQWFLSMDENNLRKRMLEAIKGVNWFPATSQKRIEAMISGRPDWCISRQRPWGVGIPIFYGKESGEPVLDPTALEAVAQIVEKEGSEAWWSRSPEEILPKGYKHPETGETEFRKETDVFDVWFDSACTSLVVLEGNVEPRWEEPWPADLFLEGSDQHRGWFNVSLIVGMGTRDAAPYKQVLTHGMVTDAEGRKMSKRLGNAVDPVEACGQYGADIIRHWAATVDFENDVPISEELLKTVGERYRRIRNTLRFLLSNLFDYDPQADVELEDLDRWIVERTDVVVAEGLRNYAAYDFRQVEYDVNYFCAEELSAFYLDVIKDRMYCDSPDSKRRRSAQKACHDVLLRLTKLVSPILMHTAEEVYERIPGIERLESVHMEVLDSVGQNRAAEIKQSERYQRYRRLIKERGWVYAEYEKWKAAGGLKDTQDAIAQLMVPKDTLEFLRSFGADLPLYMKFSDVELVEAESTQVEFRESPYPKCERSRLRRADVEEVNGVPLSARDRQVLGV